MMKLELQIVCLDSLMINGENMPIGDFSTTASLPGSLTNDVEKVMTFPLSPKFQCCMFEKMSLNSIMSLQL